MLVARSENESLVPSSYIGVFTVSLTLVPGDPILSLGLGKHNTYIHTYTHTHPHTHIPHTRE